MNRDQQIIARAVAEADRLSHSEGWPGCVTLTIYESDADYYALRPYEGRVPPAATRQAALVVAVAEALRLRGHLVKLVPLRVADYRAWLTTTNRKNTDGNRAAWASLQSQ